MPLKRMWKKQTMGWLAVEKKPKSTFSSEPPKEICVELFEEL